MASKDDIRHMKMALKYAAKGIGKVEPNPAVGCIIIKGNQIIGKGYHEKFGEGHAEINAIADCSSLGVKPNNATMYVTLEPCSHQGKTGPCTDAIIDAGIKKVFVATLDTQEHASGQGIGILKKAGVEVEVGLCELEAKEINAGFLKYAQTKKPWVILKWAQTIDGFLAWKDSKQQWISSEPSRKDVHNIRRRVDAIITGIGTVVADNPLLTPRPAKGKSPWRVVIDSNFQIPLGSRILNTKGKTAIFTTVRAAEANPQKVERINAKGAKLITVPEFENRCDIEAALYLLGEMGCMQILVEAGPTLMNGFLKSKQADQIVNYIAPKISGELGDVSITSLMQNIAEPINLCHVTTQQLGEDTKVSGYLKPLV